MKTTKNTTDRNEFNAVNEVISENISGLFGICKELERRISSLEGYYPIIAQVDLDTDNLAEKIEEIETVLHALLKHLQIHISSDYGWHADIKQPSPNPGWKPSPHYKHSPDSPDDGPEKSG